MLTVGVWSNATTCDNHFLYFAKPTLNESDLSFQCVHGKKHRLYGAIDLHLKFGFSTSNLV